MTETADAMDGRTANKLTKAITALQETVERQAERIEELETELAEHKDHTGREFADVRGRVTQVENELPEGDYSDENPTQEDEKESSTTEQTPLKRICSLPEHMAARELTANQERARFIAKDIHDYAEKAPAGLVIDSRAIKRVITAKEGTRPHTQTVARVMDFLDDLGKQDVQQKKRRGKKLVVVDPQAATQYAKATNHTRCDGEHDLAHSESVIP